MNFGMHETLPLPGRTEMSASLAAYSQYGRVGPFPHAAANREEILSTHCFSGIWLRDMPSSRVKRDSGACLFHCARGEPHGFEDFGVSRATAEIARKIVADFIVAGIGILLQKLMGHQHKTRRAETALECTRLDERLLHGRKRAAFVQMLDGCDAFSVDANGKIETARDRDIVDQDRTAAAQSLAATLTRAEQPQFMQQFNEIAMRGNRGAHGASVERKANGASLAHCASASGRPSAARSAFSTASGLMGSSVRRMPTASSMALAMAGETPNVEDSPIPLAPNGPVSWVAVTNSDSMTGTSRKPGIL